MTESDITGIHHVGLIVHDMDAAIAVFERLGFRIGAPGYPALPPAPGEPPEPVGAGNTHADFPRNFIELLALAPKRSQDLPARARLIPLSLPDDRLAATRAAMRHTVGNLADRLELSEGAHILVFAAADAERTAARLDAAGVGHGGARAAQRPVTTVHGTSLAGVKYLEINDDDPSRPAGMLPEGRVGAAEDAPPELLDAQVGLDHPNGATGLAESVLCVADHRLTETAERYERYLDLPATIGGPTASFDLGQNHLTLTTADGLAARLPGEHPRATPGVCAYTVQFADPAAAADQLRGSGVPVRESADGRGFVPADAACGAAMILDGAAAEHARRPAG